METKKIAGFDVEFLPSRRRFENLWVDFEPNKRVVLPKGWRREGRLPLRESIIWTRDVPVKMRDGITLYVDVLRPANRENEKLPTLIPWSPYGKSGTGFFQTKDYLYVGVPMSHTSGLEKFEGPDPADWCARGYVMVQPDARGTFNSEGDVYHYGSQEAQDGYDTIEWAAQQSWSNGNIGLVGNSHLGTMQWFIAAERPPHLKAIAPWEGVGDFYRQSLCRGGIPNTAFWRALSGSMQGNNLREDFATMIEKHPHYNQYWADKTPKIKNIEIPMLRIHPTQEWHDLYQPESNDDLQRFMDHYLAGKDNGWEFTPKVRVSLLRFNRPAIAHRVEDNYPPSRTTYRTLYLDSKAGSLVPEVPMQDATVSYASDDWEDDGAHFTYKFDKYTELVGPSKATLYMSTKASDDMDVFVIIRKLDMEGRPLISLNIPLKNQPHGTREEDIDDMNLYKHNGPSGRLRASKRALDQDPDLSEAQRRSQTPTELWYPYTKEEKVPPGQVVELQIAIWPSGIAFEAGESLRFEVKGHDHPLHEFVGIHKQLTTLNTGEHTIHTGGSHASHVLLPFLT
ncbi:Cocaine esterase [Cyphellophora attinorum]|uniref:Cocaine esterase n=1 Tax=Cyphellophora attinorum TaxID=1664694 RepID=A0A0N1GX73_9EURO|nr:Cocaine esterase [Phialophora attinorum]KPI34684.1 Cocaine esterase [Phialophora attinorum]